MHFIVAYEMLYVEKVDFKLKEFRIWSPNSEIVFKIIIRRQNKVASRSAAVLFKFFFFFLNEKFLTSSRHAVDQSVPVLLIQSSLLSQRCHLPQLLPWGHDTNNLWPLLSARKTKCIKLISYTRKDSHKVILVLVQERYRNSNFTKYHVDNR